MMSGWKTWCAAGLVALSAVLGFFGYDELGRIVLEFAAAVGLIGVGHKIEKAFRNRK